MRAFASIELSEDELLNAHPDALLPVEAAAILLHKSPATVQTCISRAPHSIPTVTRIGRMVFFRKSDIDAFLWECRVERKRAVGRPSNAPARATGK